MTKLVKVSLVRFHSIVQHILDLYPSIKNKEKGESHAVPSQNLYKLKEIYPLVFKGKFYNFPKSKYEEYIKFCAAKDGELIIDFDVIIHIKKNQLNYIAKLYLENLEAVWEDLNSLHQPITFLNNSHWNLYFIKCIDKTYYLSNYYISFEGKFCKMYALESEEYIGLYEVDPTSLNCFVNFKIKSKSGRNLIRNLMLNARGAGDGLPLGTPINTNGNNSNTTIEYVEGILSGNSIKDTLISNIVLLKSISKKEFDSKHTSSLDIQFYSKEYDTLIKEDPIIHAYFKETHINRIRTSGKIIPSKQALINEIKKKNRLTYPIKRKIYISAPNGSTNEHYKEAWTDSVRFIKEALMKKFKINHEAIFSKILDLESSNTPTGENHYMEPIETHRTAFISIVLLPFGLSTSAFVEACWSCLYNKNHFENPVKPTLVLLDEKYKEDIPSFFNNKSISTVTMPVQFISTRFFDKKNNSFEKNNILKLCIDFLTKYSDELQQ